MRHLLHGVVVVVEVVLLLLLLRLLLSHMPLLLSQRLAASQRPGCPLKLR